MKRKFEHLKTFENFSNFNQEDVNESRMSKKAYRRTSEFLEGDSKEAKEVNDLYDKYLSGKSAKEVMRDPKLKNISMRISRLGAKFAKENKMSAKDYTYSMVRTVKEGDFDRKFHGGVDVTIGENHEYSREEMIEMICRGEDCLYSVEELSEMSDDELKVLCSHNEGLRDMFTSKIGRKS